MTSAGLLVLASGLLLMALVGVPEVNRRLRGMFHGWFMAGLGALIAVLGNTPFYWGLPIWNPVLRNAFGWTAGQMSWAFAITQAEGGILGPVKGFLVQTLGPRRMVFVGLTIFGLGFVWFSQVRELWQLYTAFFILSLGSGLAGTLPMQTVMNSWFVRYKSRAMSLLAEGLAIGGIVIPLLLAWSIGGTDPDISERFGWSNTALFIGFLIIAIAFPISRLVHNRPEDLGLRPDGDPPLPTAASSGNSSAGNTEAEEEGYTWQEALRSKTFWLLTSIETVFNSVIAVTLVHLGLMLDDRGFSLQTIGVVTAVYTGTTAIFMLVGGYLGDRFPIRMVACGFSVLQSLSVAVLVLAHSVDMLFLFAVLWGVGYGARFPVIHAIRGVYFGRKAFAAISGIARVPTSIAPFIAPLFAGFMRDSTGTYDVAFLTIAAVAFSWSFLFLMIGERPKFTPGTAKSS